jgi:hypothetical protein
MSKKAEDSLLADVLLLLLVCAVLAVLSWTVGYRFLIEPMRRNFDECGKVALCAPGTQEAP